MCFVVISMVFHWKSRCARVLYIYPKRARKKLVSKDTNVDPKIYSSAEEIERYLVQTILLVILTS